MFDVLESLEKRLPLLGWLKCYTLDAAVSDAVAGVTIGLTLIPQSIAYAALAGLEPQCGLYSSICGGIIYACFGTVPELSIAPTALLSLVTYNYINFTRFSKTHAAILLCFLSGIVELACGLLHLGFLVDFVSIPVVAAFTSAGAIIIASSQIKNLLGLRFQAESFTDVWANVFRHFGELKKMDAILGISCCAVLLALRKLKDCGMPPFTSDGFSKGESSNFKKILWFVSVARNAFVVVGCAVIVYCLSLWDIHIFSLTPHVPSGWPIVSPPAFTIAHRNTTITFPHMVTELGTSILVIPFIAILANVGIAKAFAHGKLVDASQEMAAVGLCNIFGAFFGSYPVNASFSRAAILNASGVKTPLAGVYTGMLILIAFSILMPYFSYIPKATLSAVVICAVIFLVEISITKMIWQISKMDLVPFLITLIACLFLGIEIGILVGISADLLKVLYLSARPTILVAKVSCSKYYIRVTPSASILFPSAEYVREKILKYNLGLGRQVDVVLIDCRRIIYLDYTAGKCLGALVSDLKKCGKSVALLAPSGHISEILRHVCHGEIRIYEEEIDFQKSLTEKYGTIENGDAKMTITTQL